MATNYRRGSAVSKSSTRTQGFEIIPMLKSVEMMAQMSGIGENTLRRLMDEGKLEFVQIGNRRLLADKAIWKFYKAYKVPALEPQRMGA